jgi:hypothetical protein
VIAHQQIERHEARVVATVKKQIVKSCAVHVYRGSKSRHQSRLLYRAGQWRLVFQVRKGSEPMSIPRKQLRASVFDYGECAEAIPFDFKHEVRIIERGFPLTQRHWLELHSGYCKWYSSRAYLLRTFPSRSGSR